MHKRSMDGQQYANEVSNIQMRARYRERESVAERETEIDMEGGRKRQRADG